MTRLIACIVFQSILLLICGCASDQPTEHPYKIEHQYAVSDPQFTQTMANLLGPPLIDGNSVKTLRNGEQIFPPMLEAIRAAKKTVNFETYIYWSGQVGANFAAVLCERAEHGVQVRVILDTMGSDRIDPRYVKQMTECGVHVVKYHPLHWYDFGNANKINNRTHRKLLIVDGEVGFTGGVGIADEWLGNADSPKHWRDNHYMIEGPAVAQLQAAFVDNWMEATGEVLHGDDCFPKVKNAGAQWTQVFRSSPQGGSESMELMFLLSMAAAEKNIRIGSAYFIPDKLTRQTLIDARKRGVRVQIIVPGPQIDEKIVRPTSRSLWGEMLQAGVEIYEFQPTMYHTKLMVIDDAWVSIGSANMDNRSFRLNDEANLNIMDRDFAMQQVNIFDDDLKQSHQVTFDEWSHRPMSEKMTGAFTSLFGWLM